MTVTDHAPASADEAAVLSKAVLRAAERLGLKGGELARVLGVSSATVSRLQRGGYTLNPRGKEWELAVLLVRIFRALDSIVAGEEEARCWFNSDNDGLNGRPRELITQAEGLVHVARYLDARRGTG